MVDIAYLKNQRIVSLESSHSIKRIQALLKSLAQKFGQFLPAGILIDAPINRETLRQLAGDKPESCSPIVTQLKEAGYLSRNRCQLIINDKTIWNSFKSGAGEAVGENE